LKRIGKIGSFHKKLKRIGKIGNTWGLFHKTLKRIGKTGGIPQEVEEDRYFIILEVLGTPGIIIYSTRGRGGSVRLAGLGTPGV
jgi:hypothetical protein